MISDEDRQWMQHAIALAKVAATHEEVPVGAILVHNQQIVGEGWNRPIQHCDPSAHAEIIALRAAAIALNNYRLVQSTLYVTLEPCIMCVGAIVHARVQRVVFGAYDQRAGAVVSAFQMGETDKLNHRVCYEGGVYADECGDLLKKFFQARRCRAKSKTCPPFSIK